jgi:hypothetical protein
MCPAHELGTAPPLAPSVWWRRLALLVAELVVALVVGTVVVWACVSYGDWRTTSDGGHGRMLVMLVMLAVGLPIATVWRLVHGAPLIATARRREPGAWMTPVAYVEDREIETGTWLFHRRTQIHHHWWIALYVEGADTAGAPEVVLEVSERVATRARTRRRVAVYGHDRFGRRAVMAPDGHMVWPRSQDSALPARTPLA